MASLRIAVTGGSGRVGQTVVSELLARGHQVLNLDRRAVPDSRARFVYLDLRERYQVQPVLEQVEAVVHLGESPGTYRGLSPEELYAHNSTIGAVVIQTAADLRLKRMIYASSCQVYGCWGESNNLVPPLRLPVDESHPVQPQNAYALAKVGNEQYAQLTARDSGLSIAIFRLPAVILGEQLDRTWHWMTGKTQYGREGFGTYVGAQDAARAISLALENSRPGCEVYNLSADEVMYLKPLAEVHTGPFAPPPGWPAFKSLLVSEKAKQHFSWQPTWSFLDEYTRRTGQDPRKTG